MSMSDVVETATALANLLERADLVRALEAENCALLGRLIALQDRLDRLSGREVDTTWELARLNDTLLNAKRSLGELQIAKRHAEAEIEFLRAWIERHHGPCVHTDCDTSFCEMGREIRDKWRRAA